jgi:hypothetical protein
MNSPFSGFTASKKRNGSGSVNRGLKAGLTFSVNHTFYRVSSDNLLQEAQHVLAVILALLSIDHLSPLGHLLILYNEFIIELPFSQFAYFLLKGVPIDKFCESHKNKRLKNTEPSEWCTVRSAKLREFRLIRSVGLKYGRGTIFFHFEIIVFQMFILRRRFDSKVLTKKPFPNRI